MRNLTKMILSVWFMDNGTTLQTLDNKPKQLFQWTFL